MVQKKKKKNQKKPSLYTASTADRHELYQLSVQAPENEIDFIQKTYRGLYKKRPLHLREDFCGTALLCAKWVDSHKERTAVGVDICADTLAWGQEHNIAPLGEAAQRVQLVQDDVRAKRPGRFDVINALNFSYWILPTRDEMRGYFQAVRKSLRPEGLFLLDAYGGWEGHQPMREPRKIAAGFTYVWEQATFDPLSHRAMNYIHFEFKDGTKMEKAFEYEWRFWSLPEIQELLQEAGFSQVRVYWDVSPTEDEEDYRVVKKASNQPGWLAYLVAIP